MLELEEINFNGEIYVKKSSIATNAPSFDEDDANHPYCIFRGHECGVHAGYLVEHPVFGSHNAVKVAQARRLWKWDSKFTLTELANNGPRKAENCKFSEPSKNEILLLDVFEILPCTKESAKWLKEVYSYDPDA
jgi:hypothetical protein